MSATFWLGAAVAAGAVGLAIYLESFPVVAVPAAAVAVALTVVLGARSIVRQGRSAPLFGVATPSSHPLLTLPNGLGPDSLGRSQVLAWLKVLDRQLRGGPGSFPAPVEEAALLRASDAVFRRYVDDALTELERYS